MILEAQPAVHSPHSSTYSAQQPNAPAGLCRSSPELPLHRYDDFGHACSQTGCGAPVR